MDINKTKLHYSSQVLPASEMCLLIVVSGKKSIFIWAIWDAGMAIFSVSKLVSSLSWLYFSFCEVISFLIYSTQNTNIMSSFGVYFAYPRLIYALGPYCATSAFFSLKLRSQIEKNECVRMFWLSWLQGVSVYSGNTLQPLICLSTNK